jgi:hypothetical protein
MTNNFSNFILSNIKLDAAWVNDMRTKETKNSTVINTKLSELELRVRNDENHTKINIKVHELFNQYGTQFNNEQFERYAQIKSHCAH